MGNCGRKREAEVPVEAPNAGAGGGSDQRKSNDSGRNESRNHHDHDLHPVNSNFEKTTTKAKSVKKSRAKKKQSVEERTEQRTSGISRYNLTSGYMKRASEKAEKERLATVDELKSGLDKRGKGLEQIEGDAEELNAEAHTFYNNTLLLAEPEEARRGSDGSTKTKKTIRSFFSIKSKSILSQIFKADHE